MVDPESLILLVSINLASVVILAFATCFLSYHTRRNICIYSIPGCQLPSSSISDSFSLSLIHPGLMLAVLVEPESNLSDTCLLSEKSWIYSYYPRRDTY